MPVTHLINATLDGRCDHRDVIADDGLHAHALETFADADVILFGSGTYRLLAPYWSRVAKEGQGSDLVNEFARVFAAKPKILFFRHRTRVARVEYHGGQVRPANSGARTDVRRNGPAGCSGQSPTGPHAARGRTCRPATPVAAADGGRCRSRVVRRRRTTRGIDSPVGSVDAVWRGGTRLRLPRTAA